jgi:F-type H+-transporting ATPase subunit b
MLASIYGLILAAGEGVEAPNPILPEVKEIIWGGLAFVIVFVMLAKFGIPAVKKTMENRTSKIEGDLKAAESARAEAEKVLAEYRAQLADAKGESNRIIEEARLQADAVRKDMLARAESDAAAVRSKATEDLAAQAERVKADLQAHVKTLSIELAEKVVGSNLDRSANEALVDRYIAELNK